MAIDSQDKRRSALYPSVMPVPAGIISSADRRQVLWIYPFSEVAPSPIVEERPAGAQPTVRFRPFMAITKGIIYSPSNIGTIRGIKRSETGVIFSPSDKGIIFTSDKHRRKN